ncbi:ATP-binding protein [Flavobacterium sp. NRK1]|uniref:tetratricopeptide repeat-containing sensor histidine kinase n=1 Tax=Flavobacterium sp. NRK1 TaxID=2954929 RepID=UPI0020927EB0|nr:ATP-binding protein [Flavobacterium sp. NRK1]MCO6146594.1 ATP-binding protein [Flavobacterium sp. NRK1]
MTDLKNIRESSLAKPEKAFYNFLMAQCFDADDKFNKAYQYYLKAKKLYTQIDSISMAMDINMNIANLIHVQENHTDIYKKYFKEYMDYAEKSNNLKKIARGYQALGNFRSGENKPEESISFYKKAIELYSKANNKKEANKIYINISAIYIEDLHKPDSALFYLNKQLDGMKDYGDIQNLCYNYVNQASAYYNLKNYNKAIEYLKLADNLPIKDHRSMVNQYIYEFLSMNYDSIRDYKNAYKYLMLNKKYADSINIEEQNIAINDLDTKYKTKEKELENTLLKSKVKTSRILIYSIAVILLAIVVIAFLMIKNSRRREKISKQEKLIEQQKFEKALKDYELNSIDMMLEGQEKERQRIANDLHDNLGSMLATLKLNFENLKLRKIELREEENKLYERTDELIEEAYQKVRRIAHAKNAGVFASEGLIPAIKKLAEKISIPGKLQLQVISFGFKERMENTLEIAIFRTVQELATNIIKHSQATEATIHMTDHDDNINIIIEDNGVGFDSSKINTADGMGLANIKKKIAQLGGTLEIDSTPGKGTTIIIDIPVND